MSEAELYYLAATFTGVGLALLFAAIIGMVHELRRT